MNWGKSVISESKIIQELFISTTKYGKLELNYYNELLKKVNDHEKNYFKFK